MKIKLAIAGAAVLTAVAPFSTTAADKLGAGLPTRIDSAVFARRPFVRSPVLSPDGAMLAFRTKAEEREIVGYKPINGALKLIAVPPKYELNWFRWAGPKRLLISIGKTEIFRSDDVRRNALIAYDTATDKAVFVGRKDQGFDGDNVIYTDPDGAFALVSVQGTIFQYPSVYRADLATGRLKQVQGEKAPIWSWVADDAGVVRAGWGVEYGKYVLYYRSAEGKPYVRVMSRKAGKDDEKEDAIGQEEIAAGSDEGYVLTTLGNGYRALRKFNFATREVGETVYSVPKQDIEAFAMKRDGSAPLAAVYADDIERTHWFDPALATVQTNIDKALGGRRGSIVSRSEDNSVLLVEVASSNDPGHYYIFRPAEGAMSRLASRNDKLSAAQLSAAKAITYKTRDGLSVRGYLTLPKGSTGKNLPLILMPHGGPYGVRDYLEYDPDAQFLANRGYAVFQPNYRGSSGYGVDFTEAGQGQIGRKMQDDLDDAMDFLVKEGIADKDRVCVAGASYGGYAAMWAVTRNPERYRCAASLAGVSDMSRQLKYDKKFLYAGAGEHWRRYVKGDDKFDMDAVSALPQVARLTRPVLLGHGEDDTRVLYKQSKLYAEALKSASKTYEFYSYKKEGHGLVNEVNQKDWYDKLEAFLRKYNPSE